MGANTRLDTLHDLARHKANLRVECGTCGKVSIIDAGRFARYCLLKRWTTQLPQLRMRLVCERCGARAACLRATPDRAGADRFPTSESEWKRLYRCLRD